jgi:antitoxin (DNA-binding transcriptional repressor) of toxin-antitoxin stability system
MKVSMADVNKKPNQIINQVVESGEPAIILKHGKPIAEIRPLPGSAERDKAIAFLSTLEPVAVSTPLEQVIEEGRGRGL